MIEACALKMCDAGACDEGEVCENERCIDSNTRQQILVTSCRDGLECHAWGGQDGVCLPQNCRQNRCPAGHVCRHDGYCEHLNPCDPGGEGRNCGPEIGLNRCIPIPDRAGSQFCSRQPVAAAPDGRCRSNDDCTNNFQCRPTDGACIGWGAMCDEVPDRTQHYCSIEPQTLSPPACETNVLDSCNHVQGFADVGLMCAAATPYLGYTPNDNEGVCTPTTCQSHLNCPVGQVCAVRNDNLQCEQIVMCRGPLGASGNWCPPEEECIPFWGYGLHTLNDLCTNNVSCRTDDQCGDGRKCINRVCMQRGGCPDGPNTYHGMCFPVAREDGLGNDWYGEDAVLFSDLTQLGQANLASNLPARGRNVYAYTKVQPGPLDLQVTPAQGQGWLPAIACFAHWRREVGVATEGFNHGCELTVPQNVPIGTQIRFIVHRLDMLDENDVTIQVRVLQ